MFAFEKDKKRFELLSSRLNKFEAENVTPLHQDFLTVNTQDYPSVRFVMADPSCSGSGMLNNFFFEKKEKKDKSRLENLATF